MLPEVTGEMIARWRERHTHADIQLEGVRSAIWITGPVDVVPLLRMREQVASFPWIDVPPGWTDLQILAFGEPEDRASTKIGGIPYRPAGKEWPVDADDDPLLFLCQFNFSLSRDLVGNLPGDILLIFSDQSMIAPGSEQEQLYFEWYDQNLSESLQQAPTPRCEEIISCHGYRMRIEEYLSPFPESAFKRTLEFWDISMRVGPSYYKTFGHTLASPWGTKIGGRPIWGMRPTDNDDVARPGYRYLCSLSNHIARSGVRDPWVNVEREWTTQEVLQPKSHLYLGPEAVMNIYLTESGAVDCRIKKVW